LYNVLIVYHSHSGIVEKMAFAVKKGIEKNKELQVEMKKAQDATWEDIKKASGLAVGTPDYFDYMAGTVKDFFDRTFYPSQSKVKGSLTANIPCVFFVSGGTGGEPAVKSLKKIGQVFRFNIIDYVAGGREFDEDFLLKCEKLGGKLGDNILHK